MAKLGQSDYENRLVMAAHCLITTPTSHRIAFFDTRRCICGKATPDDSLYCSVDCKYEDDVVRVSADSDSAVHVAVQLEPQNGLQQMFANTISNSTTTTASAGSMHSINTSFTNATGTGNTRFSMLLQKQQPFQQQHYNNYPRSQTCVPFVKTFDLISSYNRNYFLAMTKKVTAVATVAPFASFNGDDDNDDDCPVLLAPTPMYKKPKMVSFLNAYS
ncbi:hypothetical protein HK100_012393 [Physocladia obscura]|uniref:Uncharacterized protein n=1 Tax=Physocladia obscura TaxID=109957 RepID=A0AAD5T1J5_9FUNG|nr:hypothetical protein HK100_012393 [Physocladia obscura]